MDKKKNLTHITGTFLIQADAAFLNGAGLSDGEDRNVTVPKTYQDGLGNRVPYVSAQSWRRWLRNTLIEETGWPQSIITAIGQSEKGTTNKIAGELNPVEFAEDDIFGYMQAKKGQGKAAQLEDDSEESDDGNNEEQENKKVKAVMRASPFTSSVLVSIRKRGWKGLDKAFVHLREGTPQPYSTEFYNTHLQGIFCLNYSRLGVYWNLGDRIELDEGMIAKFSKESKIEDITATEPYKTLSNSGKSGKIYKIKAGVKPTPKDRAEALFKALSVLRGGAKQAQFGTDVSPKVIILAGMSCGNPIFNHIFEERDGGVVLNTKILKEIISDYSDRISTPVLIGIRSGYLNNEDAVKKDLEKEIGDGSIILKTPIDIAKEIGTYL